MLTITRIISYNSKKTLNPARMSKAEWMRQSRNGAQYDKGMDLKLRREWARANNMCGVCTVRPVKDDCRSCEVCIERQKVRRK